MAIENIRYYILINRGLSPIHAYSLRSYDAKTASGMYVSPVTYAVLCVRFAWPLFAFAAVVTANNAPPETQHSIMVVG